jgi:hypothetical protein
VFVSLVLGGLYLVTAHRQLRSIVVLMAVWLTAAFVGVLAALWLTSPAWLCTGDHAGLAEWALAAGGLTLAVLVNISDAIVLDLRGFSRERQGAVFEIELLTQHGLLPRLLALGDSTTDWPQFGALLRRAGHDPEDAARLQVAARDSGEGVVSALMRLATGQTLDT